MKTPASHRKIRFIIPIIIIIAGIAIYKYKTTNGIPDNIVTASGTVEATEIDISSRVGGRILTLNVDEGDTVEKGQVIAVIDAQELSARVSQAQGLLSTAEAKLADLIKGSREEQIREASANYQKALVSAHGAKNVYATVAESHYKNTELKSNLAVAKANYEAARKMCDAAAAGLALVRKGPRQEEIDRLKANINNAKAQLTNSERDCKRYTALYKSGAISNQQLDSALALRDSLQASVDAATATYDAAISGSRPEEKEEAEAKLAEANARLSGANEVLAAAKEAYADRLESLQRVQNANTTSQSANAQVIAAKAALDLTLAGATSDQIRAAQGQVEQARGALAEAKSQLGQTSIVAPQSGVVTVKSREVGEVIGAGAPIVRIANLARVWLRVYAPLPSLGKIKLGQNTSIHTDTYKGKTYYGKVASIKEEPEFTPKNVQTTEERVKLVYAIRIDIDNQSRELKPGMPADAEIQITTTLAKR